MRHTVNELTTERINISLDGRVFCNVSEQGQSLNEHADAIWKPRVVAPVINRRERRICPPILFSEKISEHCQEKRIERTRIRRAEIFHGVNIQSSLITFKGNNRIFFVDIFFKVDVRQNLNVSICKNWVKIIFCVGEFIGGASFHFVERNFKARISFFAQNFSVIGGVEVVEENILRWAVVNNMVEVEEQIIFIRRGENFSAIKRLLY